MQLTLAMGLKYEHGGRYPLLPEQKQGQESAPSGMEKTLPVIDVEAVEEPQNVVPGSGSIRHFEYLVYDFHAGVVWIPEVGSRLDTII